MLTPAKAANLAALMAGLLALIPAFRCWRLLRPTALRIIAVWLVLAVVSYVAAAAVYLADMSVAWVEAARIAAAVLTGALGVVVLGARGPREAAWHVILASYVLVVFFPVFEQAVTSRWQAGSRPALDWLRVALLLLIAALTMANYAVSRLRYAVAAGSIGAAVQAMLASPWPIPSRDAFFAVSVLVVAGSLLSCSSLQLASAAGGPLDCRWRLFRDLWGIAWAFRIQERFNQEANRKGWRAWITWAEVVEPDDPVVRASAVELFESLVRRFATAEWFVGLCPHPDHPNADDDKTGAGRSDAGTC